MTSAATEPAWYLRHNDGNIHGPFSLEQLIRAAAQGNVAADTEVRHQKHTQNRWILASRIRQIAGAMSSAAPHEPPPIDDGPKTVQPPAGWPRDPQPAEQSTADKPDKFAIEAVPRHQSRRQMIVPATLGAAFFAIFDFRFRYFVTPWIVRAQWAIFVSVMLMLMALVLFGTVISPLIDSVSSTVSSGDTDSFSPLPGWSPPSRRSSGPSWTADAFSFVGSAIGKAFGLFTFFAFCAASMLYVRMLLESVIVFFRIAEDMSSVNDVVHRYRGEIQR